MIWHICIFLFKLPLYIREINLCYLQDVQKLTDHVTRNVILHRVSAVKGYIAKHMAQT